MDLYRHFLAARDLPACRDTHFLQLVRHAMSKAFWHMYIHKVIIYMSGVLVCTMRMMHLGIGPDPSSAQEDSSGEETSAKSKSPKLTLTFCITGFTVAIAFINIGWVCMMTGRWSKTAFGVHRSLTGGTLHISRSMSFGHDYALLHGLISPSHKTPSGISYNPLIDISYNSLITSEQLHQQLHSTVVSPYTFEVFNETSDDDDQMTAHKRMMQANARTVMMCDLKTNRTVCNYAGEGKFGTCTADTDIAVTAIPTANEGNKGNYLQICGIKCHAVDDANIEKCCDTLQGLTNTEVECCQPDFYGDVAADDKTFGKYSIQWKDGQYEWTNTREEEVCKLTHHSHLVVARNVSPRGFAKNHSENLLYATILILFNFWVFNIGNKYLNRHTMTEYEPGVLKIGTVVWLVIVGLSIGLVLFPQNDGHVDVMKLDDQLLTREYANGTYAYFCLCIFLVLVYNALIICFNWARVAQIIYDDAKTGYGYGSRNVKKGFDFGSEKVRKVYDQFNDNQTDNKGQFQQLKNDDEQEATGQLGFPVRSQMKWKVGSFGVRDKHKVVVHEFGGPLTGGGYRPAYTGVPKIDVPRVNEGIQDRDALCDYMEWDADSFYIALILPAIALVGVVTRHVYTLDVNVAAVTWGLLGLGVLLTLFCQFTKICAVTELIGARVGSNSSAGMLRYFTRPFSVIGILGLVVYSVVGIGYLWAINIIRRGLHDEHEVMDIPWSVKVDDPKRSFEVWIWLAYVIQLLMYGKTALNAYQLLSPAESKESSWISKYMFGGREFRSALVISFIVVIWIFTFTLIIEGFDESDDKTGNTQKMLMGQCAHTEEGVFPTTPRHYFERQNCVWTGGLHEYKISGAAY